jgi:O-succinylbenzoate synthase
VALASLAGFTLPGDLSPSERYWQRDVVEPEWTMDGDGMVRVPWERPGPGVEVDEDYLEEITAWREEL